MKEELFRHPLLVVRLSPIHGYGVFATGPIGEGEIIEEVPFVTVPDNVASNYVYAYPRGQTPNADHIPQRTTLPFGFACIYNHSETPNASWRTDIENELFIFYTNCPIMKDEEIRTYYGPSSYWESKPQIEIK